VIAIHAISPENELPVAERLRSRIRQAWPDIGESPRDRIDILVGVRTPAEIDLFVIVNLDRPRDVPARSLRDGGSSPAFAMQRALIVIEVKQLDPDQFDRIGNQWFAVYGGKREERSVAKQALDAAQSLAGFARQSGDHPFVHAIAWLTETPDAALRGAESLVLGREASWFDMLGAAMQQSSLLRDAHPIAMGRSVAAVRERLLNRRKEGRRDRARVERMSRDLASHALVNALVSQAGSAQIRLAGRGGSGKTTMLALLAARLAETGARVLILTFHRTLCRDITYLVASLCRSNGIPENRIQVETTTSFLLSALEDLGATIPMNGDVPDYGRLDDALDETRAMLVGGPEDSAGDVARLRTANPERFAWDHVFVDEAQDWKNSERDFLRALYGHRRLVLADGLDQLLRRQIACDWHVGIPADERKLHRLDASLRMLRNVATFVTCFAHALGFDAWHALPREELSGGRVIVAIGDVVTPEFLRSIVVAAAEQKADPVDCLICLPPRAAGDDVRSRLLVAGETANVALWDGTVAETRANPIEDRNALRLVRYESCRGLEGWIAVALDLDLFAANKLRHPNHHPADPPVPAELVAARSLLIPLTRAVHTLVVTVRDPNSDVAARLREAANDPAMPRGVVEWIDARQLPGVLAPRGEAP
jgi:hypothetical protein